MSSWAECRDAGEVRGLRVLYAQLQGVEWLLKWQGKARAERLQAMLPGLERASRLCRQLLDLT